MLTCFVCKKILKYFQLKIQIYNKKNCKKPVGVAKINQFYKTIKKKSIKYDANSRYTLWGPNLYSDISLIRYISKGLMSYFVTFSLYL